MGYSIQPVTLWVNGQQKQGNYITAILSNDNLKDSALFYYEIRHVEEDLILPHVNELLTTGNVNINGAAYDAWGQAADINLAAYQYICQQLNLTLIP